MLSTAVCIKYWAPVIILLKHMYLVDTYVFFLCFYYNAFSVFLLFFPIILKIINNFLTRYIFYYFLIYISTMCFFSFFCFFSYLFHFKGIFKNLFTNLSYFYDFYNIYIQIMIKRL